MPKHVLTVNKNYRLDDITCRHDRRVHILITKSEVCCKIFIICLDSF